MFEIYCKPMQHLLLKDKRTGGEWLPMWKSVEDSYKWTVTVLGGRPKKVVFEKTYPNEDEARRMAELLCATAFPCPEVFYPNPEPLRAAL